jgi:hypothetical protein
MTVTLEKLPMTAHSDPYVAVPPKPGLSASQVAIAREAFCAGAQWMYQGWRRSSGDHIPSGWDDKQEAARRYPAPRRPRVVRDPHNETVRWTVRDGTVKCCDADVVASTALWPTPERVKLWGDLLTRPDEDVPMAEAKL